MLPGIRKSQLSPGWASSWFGSYPPLPGFGDSFPLERERVVNFTDPQLQKCYDRNFAEATDRSGELRQIRALIDAHDMFRLMEGPHSLRVHEAIEHLLLPALRPELRNWYRRADAETNSAATEFRDHLSQLAGEKLEP
jgi:hypothetical protein